MGDKPANIAIGGIDVGAGIIARVSVTVTLPAIAVISAVTLTGITGAAIALPGISAGAPGFAVFGNLVIGGVDFLHFFRRHFRKGVVRIFIRVIFFYKLAVSLFDFLVAGVF